MKLASRTLTVFCLLQFSTSGVSADGLRLNHQRKRALHDASSIPEEATASEEHTMIQVEEEEPPKRRVFVHYKHGAEHHDATLRTIQKQSKTTLDFDFPDVDYVVVSASEHDIKVLKEQSEDVTEVIEDAKRYPMHIPPTVESIHRYLNDKEAAVLLENRRQKKRKLQNLDVQQYPSYGIGLVQADLAWEAGATGRNVKVCVIDSGIDASHPDFDSQRLTGDSLSKGEAWSVDGSGHGTHVAGIVGASNNDKGLVGVAYDADIYSVKVFSDQTGGYVYASALIDAVYKCRDAGADIINMSLGGEIGLVNEQQVFEDLYNINGILSIAAAGNFGTSAYSFPASYNTVISVGALDRNKNYAYFSQYNDRVDLAAPGVGVWSALPMNSNCEICIMDGANTYAPLDGTSQASPFVAGVAALLKSAFPDATVGEIKNALLNGAQDLGPTGPDTGYGYGLVSAMNSLEILNGGPFEDTVVTADGQVCDEGQVLIEVAVETDDYGSETAWEVVRDSDGFSVMAGAGLDSLETYTTSRCVPANCYSFKIYDARGDGLCCKYGNGQYSVTLTTNDGTVTESSTATAVASSNTFLGGEFEFSETVSLGGDCVALSTDPKPERPSCVDVTLTLITDNYPGETSVSLVSSDTTYWANEAITLPNYTYEFSECVDPTVCHTFTINDSVRDGLCCGFGNGSFDLVYQGTSVVSGSDFGESVTYNIGDGCN